MFDKYQYFLNIFTYGAPYYQAFQVSTFQFPMVVYAGLDSPPPPPPEKAIIKTVVQWTKNRNFYNQGS